MGEKIDPPLKLTIWNSERSLTFGNYDDVKAWAGAELSGWEQVISPTNGRLQKLLQQQKNHFTEIRSAAERSDLNVLGQHLEHLKTGTLLSMDSRLFPLIQRVGVVDGDAAMLLAITGRSDATNQLHAIGIQPPFDVLTKLTARSFDSLSGDEVAAGELRSELLRLKSTYDESLAESRLEFSSLQSEIRDAKTAFTDDRASRGTGWQSELNLVRDEWKNLKLVYDTELGLRAPTTYWTDRAKSHRLQAILFGIAFAATLAILVAVFSRFGLSYLTDVSSDKPAVLAVLPVLIPAFAGIWVLRILGRLLSESFHLMRDAAERETLVKTFLALMKDDVTGKSVVKEEDRILILHSLFRPSSVTATDDAPPVHWFDILANKVGQRK